VNYNTIMALFRIPEALTIRDFRLYMTGQLISLTGTWMQSVAQNWLVWSITGSSLYLGIINSASSLPMLLFTLLGGIVADRFPKKRLLILTQTLSIIPALMLGLFIDLKIITVLHIVIFAFLLGTINAFDVPARQSFLIEMVGRESLTGAIALNSAIFNGARLIGPVIAGLILSIFSISTCFYVNAISYIPVVITLRMIKIAGTPGRGEINILKDLKEAVSFVLTDKTVLQVLLMILCFSLLGIPYVILLPVITTEIFHSSAVLYGLMMGAVGAGSLSGALLIALRQEIRNKKAYIGLFTVIFSVALFLFSFSREVFLSIVLLFTTGFSVISFLATANSLIQHRTPDYLRGRVMSLYTLVFLGMAPLGNMTVGFLASYAGPVHALRALSVATFVITCGTLWLFDNRDRMLSMNSFL
jgi:MFS family permease